MSEVGNTLGDEEGCDYRDPDPIGPICQFIESRFSKAPALVILVRAPFTKKFKWVAPVSLGLESGATG